MSSKQFLILVKDYPGTIEKRLQARAQHLEGASANVAVLAGGNSILDGDVTNTLGALFSKEPTPEDPLPFTVQ